MSYASALKFRSTLESVIGKWHVYRLTPEVSYKTEIDGVVGEI